MTAEFRLVLPLSELHNSNHRGHWSVGAKKRAAMRAAAKSACADLEPIPGPVDLVITFAYPDKRPRDLDNVEAKGAIDGAVDAGVLTDDRATVLRSVTRRQSAVKAPRGYAVLTFEFTPAITAEKGA